VGFWVGLQVGLLVGKLVVFVGVGEVGSGVGRRVGFCDRP